MSKALDTYSPQDCETGVKRRMADCCLRLEAARFEAEKVVTRLIRDHEAWGQVFQEGRRGGRPWTQGRSRGSREKPTPPRRAGSKSALAARAQREAVLIWGSRKKSGLSHPEVQ